MNACSYCGALIPTVKGLKQHIQRSAECQQRYKADVRNRLATAQPFLHHSDNQDHDESVINSYQDNFVDRTYERDPSPPPQPQSSTSRRPTVEEVVDDELPGLPQRFVDPFPHPAGIPVSSARTPTAFETIRDKFGHTSTSTWTPFADEGDWELARWINQHVGQGAADSLLRLEKVSTYFFNSSYLNQSGS